MPKPHTESWLVKPTPQVQEGSSLNAPMAPAYNFVLGAGKQYSHEDSIPIWDVLETIIGGLAAGESIAFLS